MTRDCWIWPGRRRPSGATGHGYGVLYVKGRNMLYAHRYAYELFVGPIPDGLQIDHLCRERACVNPAHLEAVPQVVNIRRQPNVIAQKALTHCPQGHPYEGENLRLRAKGRGCRQCDRDASRRKWQLIAADPELRAARNADKRATWARKKEVSA